MVSALGVGILIDEAAGDGFNARNRVWGFLRQEVVTKITYAAP